MRQVVIVACTHKKVCVSKDVDIIVMWTGQDAPLFSSCSLTPS